MRLIDADALDAQIYNEIPIKVFGNMKRMAAMREIVANAPTVGGWISVKDRLPKSNLIVLVNLHNVYGKDVVLRAAHIGYHEATTDDYGWQDSEIETEYDEENDCDWIPECWWEENYVESDANYIIDECEGIITHWMPLPEPPKE